MNYLKCIIPFGIFLLASVDVDAQSRNWLSELPDNVALRELSIPGAHDAATGSGFASSSALGALFSGITQSLTLSQQWDAGIRAFDLRPTYKENVDGKLQIYHGVLETKVSLKAALQTLVDALQSNPHETALVLVRHESDGDDNSAQWAPAMSSLLEEFGDNIAVFSPSLTLGDVRGKMVILSRDSFSSDKVGIIAGWNHSENFDDQKRATVARGRDRAVLYAQDFYECQTVERKFQTVKTLLDYSTTHTSGSSWVINHTSGYVGSMGTNSNVLNLAKEINLQVADYLSTTEPGRTGIMILDFAGVKSKDNVSLYGDVLVDRIISQNLRYIDNGQSSVSDLLQDEDGGFDDRVYDLHGRCLGKGADMLTKLPAGIYIYNRKKIIL